MLLQECCEIIETFCCVPNITQKNYLGPSNLILNPLNKKKKNKKQKKKKKTKFAQITSKIAKTQEDQVKQQQ